MFEASDFFAGLALGILIYIVLRILGNASKRAPLPPGPKDFPLVGNLNDLPPPGVFEAHHWLKFKDLYAEPFKEDILIKMAGQAMDNVTAAGVPGAFLVDILPLLRYVPDWIPGANFKRLAKKWASELNDLTEKPYAFVKHQHALGKQDNSFVSRLEVGDSTEEARFMTKWSALSMYAAGADTTVSSISLFFLAMILYPDVQKKAQEEIDGVIGNARLPNCSDRQSLPYVNAIVKEVLRWNPVVPMGLPHTSTVDDVFEGYFIPKDALIMPNIWYFAHDPEVHHEPMRFNPERFLSTDGNQPEQDPHTYTFGFGRRKKREWCPTRTPIYARDDQPPRAVQSRYYTKIATTRAINPVIGAGVSLGTERQPYHNEDAAPSIMNPERVVIARIQVDQKRCRISVLLNLAEPPYA
ncbi:O-methylsterigmatocystin oxidoreductase [Fusarium acutatum]|uniref:O-methylsterigmatocystin oxidoreductase n=1 Tax=Fusarium acutatum TaxID=78861 RepID=A0A8H4JSI8_9HYPO|nr:O-methylsterigmatocystin oxidoreductase [Fusarium acutatum]